MWAFLGKKMSSVFHPMHRRTKSRMYLMQLYYALYDQRTTPYYQTSTSQNLLLAIPYTILFSNFEKLQGQGNVISASVGRDYLGTQGL